MTTELLMTDDTSQDKYMYYSYNCPELGRKITTNYAYCIIFISIFYLIFYY